ncbi:MAG: glycosyltransferase [Candidatus Acidiferrales bacterium]
MKTPSISVLIDTYNHERYIEQAIVSVLEQDFPQSEMEIFVVDDGSTDGTPSLVQKFGSRVGFIRKKNGGQASAFNAGIAAVHGRIVAFLDGDDWWVKDKLLAVAEAFEANPGIAAVGHGYFEVFDTEPPREMFVAEKTSLLDVSSPDAARIADAGLTLLGTSRLSVRRTLLARIGPIPESLVFCADAPIFTFALAFGGALILERPLCYYRRHSDNLYAPRKSNPDARRRAVDTLGFLLSYVPPRLLEFGVSPEIVEALTESARIEFERARLELGEGRRWSVFRTELQRFRTEYRRASAGYLLFEFLVGACALILPPQRFYRLRSWYGRNNVRRFRDLLGKAEPKIPPSLFQRRPVL